MQFRRFWPVLGLTTAALAACAPTAAPTDTPVARLTADVTAMKAFPGAKIDPRCASALRELTAKVRAVKALEDQGKPVDDVSNDVLTSDQNEAETLCHPEAVRLCQAASSPQAQQACVRVEGVTPAQAHAGP
ncbi:MAG TPA: hypothetical protein VFG12_03850 [Rhodopila sp.]|nr:hypothetical protein [Rhodopila sp.]